MFTVEEINKIKNGYEFVIVLASETKMRIEADYESYDPGDRYSPQTHESLDAYAWYFVFSNGEELRCNHDFVTSSISGDEFLDELKKYYSSEYNI